MAATAYGYQAALKLAEVINEAGFGADLGAEKFLDIGAGWQALYLTPWCWLQPQELLNITVKPKAELGKENSKP